MIGVLGSYFIGKRMFDTILKWTGVPSDAPKQAKYIRLTHYVEYTDLIYYGTQ